MLHLGSKFRFAKNCHLPGVIVHLSMLSLSNHPHLIPSPVPYISPRHRRGPAVQICEWTPQGSKGKRTGSQVAGSKQRKQAKRIQLVTVSMKRVDRQWWRWEFDFIKVKVICLFSYSYDENSCIFVLLILTRSSF